MAEVPIVIVKVLSVFNFLAFSIDIFDFKLTDEEMKNIAKLDKGVRYYNATPEQVATYTKVKPDLDEQK